MSSEGQPETLPHVVSQGQATRGRHPRKVGERGGDEMGLKEPSYVSVV